MLRPSYVQITVSGNQINNKSMSHSSGEAHVDRISALLSFFVRPRSLLLASQWKEIHYENFNCAMFVPWKKKKDRNFCAILRLIAYH